MKYILIILIHNHASTSVAIQEFNNVDACLVAATAIRNRLETHGKRRLKMDCVPKGRQPNSSTIGE